MKKGVGLVLFAMPRELGRLTWHLLLVGPLVLFAMWSAAPAAEAIPDVRTIYLVPSDRPVRQDYENAVADAVQAMQVWYADQLSGRTFTLHQPIVETLVIPHSAAFFPAHPTREFPLWFFDNAVTDGFAATGGGFNDPNHIFVFYIDSEPAPGQLVGATSGVALLPAHDLLGLTGQPVPGDDAGVGRYIGGLGHELGHALGLPHPPGCEAGLSTCEQGALMWLGFRSWPDTFLLPLEKTTLQASGFINNDLSPVPEPTTLLLWATTVAGLGLRRWRQRRRKEP